MGVGNQKWARLVAGLAVLLYLVGCTGKQNDKESIVAIWQIKSINVNGMEIGDGKGFLNFHADGKVESRTGPGLYDEGNYTIDPETKTLTLGQDSTKLKYEYSLVGDSLTMRSNESGMALLLRSKKVDKLPVNVEEDKLLAPN